jgi:hypothetical protein
VVAAGDTGRVPEALEADNAPGAIESEVAPEAAQDKVTDWPEVMEVGVAVKEVMVGREEEGVGAATVIDNASLALFGLAVTVTVKE